ncbi:MAG: YjjG family noncanonical pyrimidine nucleotidase [Bacteroidales bacterium]|nr:YjjG family noncanonical pyrimidine nucleotidase [Bacteroidales bacterium]
MGYRDIFFDFDDTLYDTRGNADIALTEVFRDYGLDRFFSNPQFFYDSYWKINSELWLQYNKNEISKDYLVIERFKRPLLLGNGIDVTEELCLKISDSFLSYCSDKPGVLPGCYELLDYLKAEGYRLHICSNGFNEVQYKKLRASNLTDYFSTVVLSEDAPANKPSSRFFDYAFDVTNACKDSTLMVGDNYFADVCGALDYGIDACLYRRWDKTFVPDRDVTFVVNSLKELIDVL